MLGFNNSLFSYDEVQLKLSASSQKIHLERIVFKEAMKPDQEVTYFKYKPLNAGYRPGMPLKQMKNIVNSDNDIPKPPVTLYAEGKVENDWKEIRKIGPGLANLGNTCFLNSVLQILSYTPPLVNYILSEQHKSKCKSVGFCMQCELLTHILRVSRHQPHTGGVIRPMSIIQKLQCIGKNFRFGRQEDAHEFLRYVIEGIQKSDYVGRPNLDKVSKETTVANAIFGGYLRSQVKCLHCQYESNTFDPMMDMNLDIKECSNIVQALQRSVRADRLDGDNKYFCDRCRTKRSAQKKATIHKEPNVLTLQLKRFDFSKMFGGKISKDVGFPDELNIRPFMSHPRGDDVMYRLFGVLVHSGYSCNSGHYYCYVRAPNGMWYEMNDNRVSQVGVQTVKNAQAYLLFYVKKTTKTTTTATTKNSSNVKSNLKVSNISTKHAGGNLSTMQAAGLKQLPDPFGISVPRKTEPKIVWKNQPSNIGGTKAEKLLKQKAINLSEYSSFNKTQGCSTSDKIHDTSKKQPENNLSTSLPVPNHNHNKQLHTVNNVLKENLKLNSLQRLSVSYGGDTDSPSSSAAPSPVSVDKDIENSVATGRADSETCSNVQTTSETSTLPTRKDNDLQTKDSPIRIKLNHGKIFNGGSKFSVWSPLTKAAFHPRVIINRLSDNGEKAKSTNTNSTPTKLVIDEFKNLSFSKRTRTDSINSEVSTLNGSLLNTSERKSGQREHSTSDESPHGSSIDQIKHRDGELRKRKHSCHKDNENSFERRVNVNLSVNVEIGCHCNDESTSPKKKKKKRKKKNNKEESKDDILESSLVRCSEHDSAEKVKKSKKKKKKKKRKRKHSSSDDDNSTDDGVLSKSPKEVEKCLRKHKKPKASCKDDTSKHRNSSESFAGSKHHKECSPVKETRLDSRTSKHRHSSSHTSSRRHDDSQKNKPTKEYEHENNFDSKRRNSVPSHTWDNPKKNVTTWDGSVKSGTVDYLLCGGTKVTSWSGENVNSDVYTVKNRDEKEKQQNDYDEEYDRGKQKKIKSRHPSSERDEKQSVRNSKNPFQHLQDYRNYSKDNNASHRSPTKHHHFKHRHSKTKGR